MARLGKEDLGAMSDDGERVRARRERLGMGKRDLAEQAEVSRDTLAAIEDGKGFRRSSLTKIERVLDELEEAAGITAPAASPIQPSPDLIEFDITGDFGVHLVVKGPVGDAEVLKRQVVDIIRAMRESEKEDPDGAK